MAADDALSGKPQSFEGEHEYTVTTQTAVSCKKALMMKIHSSTGTLKWYGTDTVGKSVVMGDKVWVFTPVDICFTSSLQPPS
ncbi:uncharacterized protein VDAG_05227 [Verticillium dahliae VdLs.17]|uniref:Uncharacterized protein n=1 Tax=Verticillium dahliae (strain VdLs.17 / ATCC MYA-4575 / FGSC 10137) TaxID=498257 RepID=G2X4Z5_VERDV|nr:uncharacterized protein VDAG_05227 [Verticillium dahliae VdLs.17]EGY23789.1 hypothetical protein VDAG_05227 [Verticillium dahliae VdLs.17]